MHPLPAETKAQSPDLLALVDEACGWVNDIKKVIGGGKSFTEQALQLYRFLVAGADDERGTWRETVIRYGRVSPAKVHAFVFQSNELKRRSVERVTGVCREVYNTKIEAATLVKVPKQYASKTIKELLEQGVKDVELGSAMDSTRLFWTLCEEIEILARGLGINDEGIGNIHLCLLGCVE